MDQLKKPELLSPAGDEERLRCAVEYGADAVYLGGTMFGMRASAAKFDFPALCRAADYCHEKGVKIYLTANVIPRNGEIDALPEFLLNARKAGVDALIISDMGVMAYAKKYVPDMDIHISTQSGVTNYLTAQTLLDMGARRIVPARELSLEEIREIRRKIPADAEIECFIHGAMCMSFSGRCLISNYLTGRDANNGECAQPCRWKYTLTEEQRPGEFFPVNEEEEGTFFFNSKDMCLIEHIPDLVKAGIDSFKIEGRAKSAYYVAAVTNAYRCAIDDYFKNPSDTYKPDQWIIDEMKKVSFRDYCTGFFYGPPNKNAAITYEGEYKRYWDVVAAAEKYEDGILYCTQRNRFFPGDEIEILEPKKTPFTLTPDEIFDENGEKLESVNKAMMKFSFRCEKEIAPGAILRKERKQ